MIYVCPLLDNTGNNQVRSPYTLPTSTNDANTLCVLMLVGVGSGSGESSVLASDVSVIFVVERKFLRLWMSWPLTVASYLGR
jgi:hypothetical protein